MLLGQPIRQIAYFVKDIREAARQHAALFGSGPFFILDLPPLNITYRGKDLPSWDHTACVGQLRTMQIEFIQQNASGPSILHDLYPEGSGRHGLHHLGIFVDDVDAAAAEFAKQGYGEAMRVSRSGTDLSVVHVDTVPLYGHFIELWKSKGELEELFERVQKASIGFDGRDLVRETGL